MKKDKKRNAKIILVIILALILAIALIFILTNNKDEVDDNNIFVNRFSDLPNIMTIDVNESPWLYDFINGSLGWHTGLPNDKSMTDMGLYFAILFNQNELKESHQIYISWYSFGERILRPILGTEPYQTEITNEQADKLLAIPDNGDRKVVEGDWTLLFVSMYESNDNSSDFHCDIAGRWKGIELTKFANDLNYGKMYIQVYEQGLGWPREWISNEVWYPILLKAGYDMNNEFWLRYNVDSFKIYHTDMSEAPTKDLKVSVAQLNRFKFDYGDGQVINVNLEQLQEVLSMYNYK